MKKKMRLSPLNHFQNGLATCDQILPNSFFFFLRRGRRPFLAWDWTAFQISFTFFRESPRIKPCIPFKFDTPWLDSLLKCRVSLFFIELKPELSYFASTCIIHLWLPLRLISSGDLVHLWQKILLNNEETTEPLWFLYWQKIATPVARIMKQWVLHF